MPGWPAMDYRRFEKNMQDALKTNWRNALMMDSG